MSELQRMKLIQEEYEARRRTIGAEDGFRGNQHTKVVSGENRHLADTPEIVRTGTHGGDRKSSRQNDDMKGKRTNTAKRNVPKVGTKQGQPRLSQQRLALAEKFHDGVDAIRKSLFVDADFSEKAF